MHSRRLSGDCGCTRRWASDNIENFWHALLSRFPFFSSIIRTRPWKHGRAHCNRVANERTASSFWVIFIKVRDYRDCSPRFFWPFTFFRFAAHMDWGKFRDALDYGHHQLGISEELDNPQMRSEAYLNLARAHERLGEFIRFTYNVFPRSLTIGSRRWFVTAWYVFAELSVKISMVHNLKIFVRNFLNSWILVLIEKLFFLLYF